MDLFPLLFTATVWPMLTYNFSDILKQTYTLWNITQPLKRIHLNQF